MECNNVRPSDKVGEKLTPIVIGSNRGARYLQAERWPLLRDENETYSLFDPITRKVMFTHLVRWVNTFAFQNMKPLADILLQ